MNKRKLMKKRLEIGSNQMIDKNIYCTYTTQLGNTRYLMHDTNYQGVPKKQIHRFKPKDRVCLICNHKL